MRLKKHKTSIPEINLSMYEFSQYIDSIISPEYLAKIRNEISRLDEQRMEKAQHSLLLRSRNILSEPDMDPVQAFLALVSAIAAWSLGLVAIVGGPETSGNQIFTAIWCCLGGAVGGYVAYKASKSMAKNRCKRSIATEADLRKKWVMVSVKIKQLEDAEKHCCKTTPMQSRPSVNQAGTQSKYNEKHIDEEFDCNFH